MSGDARHAEPSLTRRTWVLGIVVALLAIGLGIGSGAAGARWSDERMEVLPPPVTTGAEERPVLRPAEGASPSAAGGDFALEPYEAGTGAALLGLWGIGPPTTANPIDLVAVDAAVHHVEPCSGCDGVEGIVLGGRRDPPANLAHVIPYPGAGDGLAEECRFADLRSGELPVAIVTGNPGEVEVRVGPDRYVVESDRDEVDEWEDWMDGPAGERPLGSYVVHCVAVPEPDAGGPVTIDAVASDGTAATARGVAAVVAAGGSRLPVVLRPIDATMLAVDVPLDDRSSVVVVTTTTVEDGCGTPQPPSGWRPGSESRIDVDATAGERPYLAGTTAVMRRTVALAEGEPTLLCVTGNRRQEAVVVTPPDARRVSLVLTEVAVPSAVDVAGTFAAIGWSPCLATAAPGSSETVLCTSGGDTGAIEAAGGVLDLTFGIGGERTEARLALSAAPGSADAEVYRLAAPGGGTVEVVARWTDGATGGGEAWIFGRAAPALG